MPDTLANLKATSPLRWCFSSMGCAELTLPQIAALADSAGIGLLELRAVGGKINIPELATEDNWLARSPSELLGGSPAEVVAFNSSVWLHKPFEDGLNEIKAFAPLMAHFGAGSLRVFDGKLDLFNDPDTAWQWLDNWEKARAENGWNFSLSVETHDSLFTAEEVDILLSKGHENVTLLWDSHHTWRKKGLDPLESWDTLRPWTTHIHVKDSLPEPSAKLPYTYVKPGQGEFPLRALLDRLEADGFSGPVSLEWEKLWHAEMDPLPDALRSLGEAVSRA
ncbi:TIM barrel protein [Ruficoccus sp. ZRK36]|uniref:sugar phosphate isomerase/epimerase family protein n=1 Tax=Ruficoccus sp. ZRK36 TaxID=2866311 RepID=UPI001C73A745|nr:TIM barrel protein [Ruficoccus sp. ZRK36]QYY36912.1 sugar phosphate isomerase/epimerase [Ruficoccus sp. ZRK36]